MSGIGAGQELYGFNEQMHQSLVSHRRGRRYFHCEIQTHIKEISITNTVIFLPCMWGMAH